MWSVINQATRLHTSVAWRYLIRYYEADQETRHRPERIYSDNAGDDRMWRRGFIRESMASAEWVRKRERGERQRARESSRIIRAGQQAARSAASLVSKRVTIVIIPRQAASRRRMARAQSKIGDYAMQPAMMMPDAEWLGSRQQINGWFVCLFIFFFFVTHQPGVPSGHGEIRPETQEVAQELSFLDSVYKLNGLHRILPTN
ncbi:uncharacterized protein BO80DRAFT_86567 [Aspergillus ibericus CBS 121593]|uniref:Uncharacterized protein n=1 Tax=Aspergillus ibericus CBS 121593 TaxID=1448316 RepID=A0A395HEB7_9EURO|nr:hypothetical protein BO80DRAFT_86567 [Aspergillus ibericus CBS 121593]RAL06006.1 hypothetical protein BO80DRAFT_86567 [Aspergillus ibericus CBS 121593]